VISKRRATKAHPLVLAMGGR